MRQGLIKEVLFDQHYGRDISTARLSVFVGKMS